MVINAEHDETKDATSTGKKIPVSVWIVKFKKYCYEQNLIITRQNLLALKFDVSACGWFSVVLFQGF